MPENPLEVRLEATDHDASHFILTFNSSHYPVTLNLETNVTVSDWLRHLSPVLAGHNDPSGELNQEVLLRNVGTWLWRALFPDSAPTQQRNALMQALRSGLSPLLLVLPDKLARLPWELLCDPEQPAEKGFLALRRPLMRLIASDMPVPTIELPLRVLLLISSPPSLKEDSRVDVESERAAVELPTRDMRESGLLHLLVEDIVTPKRVQQLLMRFKPHIVHYIGHGGCYEKTGGVLLWEDERGDVLPIYDRRLADILRSRNICAVILHACETGKSNARTDVYGFAGTLLKEDISAVIAQQGNFKYEASQCASSAWYTALTAGQGLAEAFFEVRRALSLADRPDWAIPILWGNAASLVPVLDAGMSVGPPDPLLSSQADLPTLTGIFVGRHCELRALRLMLENTPDSGPVLALITGPGGVGKSTLAAQAVTRYGGKYKATLTLSCLSYQSVELFLQRIGEFLKRQGAPDFLEQILPDPKLNTTTKIEEAIAVLNQTGPFLLVVDNLESVQEDQTLCDEGLLQLLQKLLTTLRGGRVLITGRYAVKDLLPTGKFATYLLRLDLDDLSPYETNLLLTRHPTLARLGETVHLILIEDFGGLPYVYDLLSSNAASQSLDLLIHDVRGRITKERKQHTAQEWQEIRQQIVEFAALEATISRLSEPSRTLLARLAVLQRPFPLAAIEQGLVATRAEWQSLLDWSLLRYDPLERSYRLHGITKRYVEDRLENLLDEQDYRQTQAKLAAWYQHYAVSESHDLADYLEAHRLWRASGTVRQAGELVLQIAEPLGRFGLYPLLRELCTTTLVDIGEGDELHVASIQFELGNLAYLQGEYEEARGLYEQSLEIRERLGDQGGRANSLHQLGMIVQDQGKYEEARGLYEQSLEIRERLGDQGGRANSLHQLGIIVQDQGKYEEARGLYEQSLEIRERLGDQGGRANSLHQLGMIVQDQGKYEEARGLYEQSLEIRERLGDQEGRASSLHQLGMIVYERGELEKALTYLLQAYMLFDSLHSPSLDTAQRTIGEIRSQMDETTFTERWGAIAGDLPLPDFSLEDAEPGVFDISPENINQQIMETLVDFVQAPTWDESKGILGSHPELLQPEVGARLQEWAMQQKNDGARQSIEEYRRLLIRCKDVGVDAAFAGLYGAKSPEATFAAAMNRICGEVILTLRAGGAERQKLLASQIEQMLREDLPIEGAADFLQVLVIWLHGQDVQTLVEKLPPVFRNAYAQMVAAIEQEEIENINEEDALSVEDLPRIVASLISQGTAEQRQQLAEELIKAQQQVMLMEIPLGRYFGCLAAVLQGETPEVVSLVAPYTDLWQEFQDALATSLDEEDQ